MAFTGHVLVSRDLGKADSASLAAHRAGIKKLVVPVACKSDIDENVPDSVKSGIEFVFVEDVRQVIHEVFAGSEAAKRWAETLPREKEPERVTVA